MKTFKEYIIESVDRIKRLDLEACIDKLDIDYTISKDTPAGFEITTKNTDKFEDLRDIIRKELNVKVSSQKTKKDNLIVSFKY